MKTLMDNLPRNLFMVLSPHALGYASHALGSLFRNNLQPFHLRLITDEAPDKDVLLEEIARHPRPGSSACSIFSKEELSERETAIFSQYPNLRTFRQGHPCWRKITDPLLLSNPGEEMVLLDSDIYFPNRFSFEPTPDQQLLLMWQRPNCLLPPEVVTSAFENGIRLANHVDIGVAHWRAPVDLDWLDWLIGKLGGVNLPHIMHVEAIVWAALAIRMGGGHLSPRYWRCWRRSQWKRMARKAGVPGVGLLRIEPFSRIKCFHAGGEAKSWLQEAARRGWMNGGQNLNLDTENMPFVELEPNRFSRELRARNLLRQPGDYSAIEPS